MNRPLRDYLTFRRMITPVFIQVIFWLALVGIVIAALAQIGDRPGTAILLLILGPLAVRIYAEILIVIFRMNDSLTDIRNVQLARAPVTTVAPPPTQPPATP